MTPNFRKVLDGWAWDEGKTMYEYPNDNWKAGYDEWKLRSPEDDMNSSTEQFMDDEQDFAAQQQIDDEARELRLIDILRRLAEGVPVTKDDVALIAAGCGIDKRDVL